MRGPFLRSCNPVQGADFELRVIVMISNRQTQMFLAEVPRGKRLLPPRAKHSHQICHLCDPAVTNSDHGTSCSERHAGQHSYFANSQKDTSLLSSGHTVLPKRHSKHSPCLKQTRSHGLSDAQHFTQICPLVSLPPTDLKCLYASGINMWKEKRAKPQNSTPTTPGLILYRGVVGWGGGTKHPTCLVTYHYKFSLPVC